MYIAMNQILMTSPRQWDYNAVTDENDLVDNANTGGLKVGRPWAT
jgi:hypothetical protein